MRAIKKGAISLNVKVGMILIIILCLLKFVLSPLHQWRQDSLDRIYMLKKSIAGKTSLVSRSEDIESELQKSSHALNSALNLFWNDFADSGELLLKVQKTLEKGAGNRRVKIKSVQWGEPTGEKIIQAPVELQLSALPDDFLGFLADIESSEKFYSLDRVRLICRANYPEVQATITVSVYGVK
jgi:hypothetical protein